ncbi:MAG: hypothetical protein WAR57_11695 [Candidatus Phosphoribacter sp.]
MARKTSIHDMKKDLHKTAGDARVQLMAVVGATDLAVEKIRETQVHFVQIARELDSKSLRKEAERFQKDIAKIQKNLGKIQDGLAKRLSVTAHDVQTAPANAVGHSIELATKAQATVEELADRGEDLVRRIRNQQSTKDLKAQVRTTVAAGKGAVTTARKAAAETEKAAVATLKTAGREARVVANKVAATVEKDAEVVADTVKASAARTRAAARRTSTTAQTGARKTTARTRATRTGVRKTAAKATTATQTAAEKVGD